MKNIDRFLAFYRASKKRSIGGVYSKASSYFLNKAKYPYYKTIFYSIGNQVFISRKARIEYAKNIMLGNNVVIGEYAMLNGFSKNRPSIVIGNNTHIRPFSMISTYGGAIKIGDNCLLNLFGVLYGHGGLEIGNDVEIATKVTIIPANHGFERIDSPMRQQPETREGIKIEDDVWIGANVTILDGVTIHRGSVVGGGQLLQKMCQNTLLLLVYLRKLLKEETRLVGEVYDK